MEKVSAKYFNWNLYGFVVASRYRRIIVEGLSRHPRTPSQLAKEFNVSLTRVSNTLSELVDKEIVMCLNPDRRKGRIYGLTRQGKRIAEAIKSNMGANT